MNATHTPGPWAVESAGFGQWRIRGAGPDYKGDIATVNIGSDPARDFADALLLASAPALLKELENLIHAAESAFPILDARVTSDIRDSNRFMTECLRAAYGKARSIVALARGS